MAEPDPTGYLMRFEDGPLAHRHNISTAGGTTGNTVVPRKLFGWPLPARLAVLTHEGVANVAFWDVDHVPDDLPAEITASPNVIVYEKVSESQLPDDGMSRVMRGALYRLKDGNG